MNLKCSSQHLSPQDKDKSLTAIWILSTLFQDRRVCKSVGVVLDQPAPKGTPGQHHSTPLRPSLSAFLRASFLSHSHY